MKAKENVFEMPKKDIQLISHILSKVSDAMKFDEDLQEFVDGGRFTLALNDSQLLTLLNFVANLNNLTTQKP